MDENDIRKLVERVLGAYTLTGGTGGTLPLEVSARHVHLTKEAVEVLFGAGAALTPKRMLSQPGEFLSEQRVKLVTAKGAIDNVAVLGPERKQVQTELSYTDCRELGIKAPVNLSGDLSGAADVVIIGERGVYEAKGSAIVAKAHIHLTPADAVRHGLSDRQSVKVKIESARPVTIEDVMVRVSESFSAAVHIDFDEANAAAAGQGTPVTIIK